MKKQFTKRILSWFLAAVMTLGMVVPMGAANTSDGAKTKETELIVEKVDNDAVSVALGDKIDDEATDDEIAADTTVRVSIVLEGDATIAHYSTENIAENSAAMQYRASLETEQNKIANKISKEVFGGKDKLDVVWNLTLAANIISANVKYGDIAAIEEIPGVQEVVLETRYEPMVVKTEEKADPNTATSGVMTGTYTAYAEGYTGAGSRIAIVDTGTDLDHQSFDADAFLYSLEQGGNEDADLLTVEEIAKVLPDLNLVEKMPSVTAEDLYINAKVPFGFNYIDKNLTVDHDSDNQGEHGSHVAGIAAANAYIPDGNGGYESALNSVKVQGAAPDAQIITMKVFGAGGGAYDSDYMAAIEDAVMLGCDSVNLSLGSGNPGFSKSTGSSADVYNGIMAALENSGTVVSMSAGNSGHWAENAYPTGYLYAEDVSMQMDGSPGSFDNSLAVASADNIGFTGAFLTVDGTNVFYTETDYTNAPIASIAGDHEFVYVDGNGTDEDFAAVADKLAGKIAVCNRGGISFYEKAENAVKHGAIATIVVNNQAGTINMDLSDYTKTAPVVSITQADGALLKAAATSNETIGGNTVYFGTMTVGGSDVASEITADHVTISSFSSWGVPGSLTLKPEITAPGGSIYSVNGAVAGGKAYETMSGTSMASPQIAGISALIAQYIEENDLVAKTGLDQRTLIQSLLMSTATPLFDYDNDGYYYPVLQQGAGLVDVGAAVKAESYILMDESSTKSAADGKVKAELGDDPDKTGKYTVSFSINNLTDAALTYELSADMFTQTPISGPINSDNDMGLYMYTTTTSLESDVEWIVNGSASADATAVVPASGKTTVVANIQLKAADMSALDEYFANGAYVEGFVYAEPVTTTEGEDGVTHSIPVLGFYGDWSAPSMYEHGQRITYITGEDKYTPYLGSIDTNTLGINYAWDDSGTYYYTGNPLLVDFYNAKIASKYLPERNAINSADTIALWRTTLIRNAAEIHLTVEDENGTKLVDQSVDKNVLSAYYYSNGSAWRNTTASMKPNITAASLGLSEGDKFTVKLSGATEYSVEENGNVAWDDLGKGASQEYSFTVDDTAPVVEQVLMTKDMVSGNPISLTVRASDNQYIAGVILTNGSGTKVYAMDTYKADAQPGGTSDFTLSLDGVNGNKFMIQVIDYAYNASTYTIREQIGEKPEVPEAMILYSDYDIDWSSWSVIFINEFRSLSFENGKTYLDEAEKLADTSSGITAVEEVNGMVFISGENGALYALRMADLADATFVANLGVSFVDMAYIDSEDKLVGLDADGNLYVVDYLDGKIIDTIDTTEDYVAIAGSTDTLYGMTNDPEELLGNLKMDFDGNGKVEEADADALLEFVAGKRASINDQANADLNGDGEITSYDAYLFLKRIEEGNKPSTNHVFEIADNGAETELASFEGYLPTSMDWAVTDGNLYYLAAQKKGSYSLYYYYVNRIDLSDGTSTQVSRDTAYSDDISCLVFPDPKGDETWTLGEGVTASSVTIDQGDSIKVIRGTSTQLTATVMPWVLEDRTAAWTTSDASVATVNANGKVIGVADGTAIITATSKDGKASDSIEVEVFYPEVSFEGALQDAEGNPILF